jgi:uncharacterized Zn finger protein
MSFYNWKPYVSAAERRRKAEKAAAKARKSGTNLSPVAASRGSIAKTFWGKAWCENLEHYSDYANRLPRGRAYVRSGSVIDLKIATSKVQAQVIGSSLYKVDVSIAAVPRMQWRSISADCAGSIDSLVELLQGRLSDSVMKRICTPNTGLFPAPKDIQFSCSCPDWASMCKHVAAVLYGVGARLDEQPELIFALRGVDAKDLVAQAGAGLPKLKQRPTAGKALDNALLADVFGIEMAEVAAAAEPAAPHRRSKAIKLSPPLVKTTVTTSRKTPTAGKAEATNKTVAAQKPRKAKKPSASPHNSTTTRAKAGGTTTVPKRLRQRDKPPVDG